MGGIIDFTSLFDISQISISDTDIILFFFKAFSVVFALLFFIFALILSRQSTILKDTLSTENNGLVVFVSQVQLVVSVLILLYALFLI